MIVPSRDAGIQAKRQGSSCAACAGECFGKAGAYGIQGPAGAWVTSITGCYFNVMGFPVHAFAAALADMIASGELPL